MLCWRSERSAFADLGLRPWPIPLGRLFRPWQLGRVQLTHGPSVQALEAPGARQVVTVHDLSYLEYPDDVPAGFAEERSALLDRQQRSIDLAICISEATEADLISHFPGYRGRTTVVHHGVGEEWFMRPDDATVQRSLSSLGIDRPYLLHIGALVPRKDLPTLVRAWKLLTNDGLDLSLVLAGPDPVRWRSDVEAIQAAAGSLSSEQRLHVVGYVDDLTARHLMAGAAAYVCISKCEGFGLPVLEAMAIGTPVVATKLPAFEEIAGETIAYVAIGDAEGCADAVRRVIRALEVDLRPRARERARRFTWADCAARTLRSYHCLLNRS